MSLFRTRARPARPVADLRPRPPDGLYGVVTPGGLVTDLPYALLRPEAGLNRDAILVAAQLSRSWTGCAFVLDTPFAIAADLGLTPRIVRRALSKLELRGWIAVHPETVNGKSCFWLRWRLPTDPAAGGGEH